MNDPNLRMSDAERDRAAAELGEHYAQGRLTIDEHAERLDRILAARTRGELGPIFADLPRSTAPAWGGHGAGATPSPRTPRRRGIRGLPVPLVVLVAVLVAVTVFAHLPLILVGLGAWFLLARKGHCANQHASRRPHWS